MFIFREVFTPAICSRARREILASALLPDKKLSYREKGARYTIRRHRLVESRALLLPYMPPGVEHTMIYTERPSIFTSFTLAYRRSPLDRRNNAKKAKSETAQKLKFRAVSNARRVPGAATRAVPSTRRRVSAVRYVRLQRTNLRVVRLSLNRSQKSSALLSTTPRLRTRSSTNDLAPLRRM